jgi:hypothetical protein
MFEVRSPKSEVWSLKSEVWSLKSEVWSLKSEVWSLKPEVWSPKSEVWSLKSLHGFRRKSIKHLSKTKSVKRFPSLKLCFSMFFFLTCTFWLQLCKIQIWRGPGPGSLTCNRHRVSGDQQVSVDSAGQLGPTACNLVVQLCRHGTATVLIEFLNNRLCHLWRILLNFMR